MDINAAGISLVGVQDITVAEIVVELLLVILNFHGLLFLLNIDGIESSFRNFQPQ